MDDRYYYRIKVWIIKTQQSYKKKRKTWIIKSLCQSYKNNIERKQYKKIWITPKKIMD
jgi:hypothetical protein